MNHVNQNINGKNLILKRNLEYNNCWRSCIASCFATCYAIKHGNTEVIENTFKKYRYSVNTSDIGIKKVSQSIKESHKQRVYAIRGIPYCPGKPFLILSADFSLSSSPLPLSSSPSLYLPHIIPHFYIEKIQKKRRKALLLFFISPHSSAVPKETPAPF